MICHHYHACTKCNNVTMLSMIQNPSCLSWPASPSPGVQKERKLKPHRQTHFMHQDRSSKHTGFQLPVEFLRTAYKYSLTLPQGQKLGILAHSLHAQPNFASEAKACVYAVIQSVIHACVRHKCLRTLMRMQ